MNTHKILIVFALFLLVMLGYAVFAFQLMENDRQELSQQLEYYKESAIDLDVKLLMCNAKVPTLAQISGSLDCFSQNEKAFMGHLGDNGDTMYLDFVNPLADETRIACQMKK